MDEMPKEEDRSDPFVEALRRSEERYRALVEAVSTAVWVWNPATEQGDFAATQRWRRRAEHPLNDPFTTRACRAAVRSAEALVAEFRALGR